MTAIGTYAFTDQQVQDAADRELGLATEDTTSGDWQDWSDFCHQAPAPLTRAPENRVFPIYALPKPYAQLADSLATSTQTDVAMAGTAVLAAISVAAAGRVLVQATTSYIEPCNIWGLPTADSGERKSSIVAEVFGPLQELETELADDAAPRIAEERIEYDIVQQSAEKAKRDAVQKAKPEDRELAKEDAKQYARDLAEMKVSELPRLIGDDTTVEAMVTRLAEQDGRFAIVSAEGGIFKTFADRYGQNTDLTPFLKAHAGDTIRVDRIGRPSEYVKTPALTMLAMIQPGVLAAAASNSAFHDSGLMARFLYVWPISMIGHRDVSPPPIDQVVRDEYRAALTELARDQWALPAPRNLTLSPEAEAKRIDHAKHVEKALGEGGELAHMRAWGSKSTGLLLRIAGLLHIASGDQFNVIGEESMNCARLLTDFYTAQAIYTFDRLASGTGDRALARRLLAWIQRKELPEFTTRDISVSAPRSWLHDAETAQRALDTLEEFGWIHRLEAKPRTGAGRRPSPRYRTHPLVRTHNPHNPRKGDPEGDEGDSVDYVDSVADTQGGERLCPIHHERVVKGDSCIACITEAATVKVQEHAA